MADGSDHGPGVKGDIPDDASQVAVTRRRSRRPLEPPRPAPPLPAGSMRRPREGPRDDAPIPKSGGFAEAEGEGQPFPEGHGAGRWLKRAGWALVLFTGFVAVAGSVAVLLAVRHYSKDLPSVSALKAGYRPPQITRVYARDQTLLASLFQERRTVVPFDKVPDSAKLAFLAAEDAHFYEHEGLNYFGMARALAANLRAGRTVQGGSTITQQVVKNILLDSRRSLRRKVRELLLARLLEQSLSKDEILWLYLNHIYLGHGRYGIEEASRYYFGKKAVQLRLDESAILAGLVAAPERYSPRRDPERALARRRYVLDQMREKGFVAEDLYEQVLRRPLRLAPAEESERKLAPEAVDQAKRLLNQLVPKAMARGGFAVTTTIDPELQAAARRAVRQNLDAYMERHKLLPPYHAAENALWGPQFRGTPKPFKIYTGVVVATDDHTGTIDVRVGDVVGRVTLSAEPRYNPKHFPPSEFTEVGAVLRVSLPEAPEPGVKPPLSLELGPQSALVALDVRTREVLALVGSYEAIAGGLDRAIQARRQPGSSFKPIVYSYALTAGHFTPATPIPVTRRAHGVAEDGPLQLSFREALAHSNNQAAIRVLRQSGAENVVQFARALGITSKLEPDLSLALGAYEVSPLEMANAYVTFANGGMAGEPRFIQQVTGAGGQPLNVAEPPPERRVLNPDEAYLTTSLLESVVREGTARAALRLRRPVAGKTGTTNESRDAWFIGYSTDLVAAVWVGFDDARPLGQRESGARTALPAWIEFMEMAHRDKPKTRFARAPDILTLTVDRATGLLPRPGQTEGLLTEEFLRGTEPGERAPDEQPDAGVRSSGGGHRGAPPGEPPPF